MRYLCILLLLSSCFYSKNATRIYNDDMTSGSSESLDIAMKFCSKSNGILSFSLYRDINSDIFSLKVRWSSGNGDINKFYQPESHVKFLIDNAFIVDLYPSSPPRTVSYNIEDNSREEEISYKISREQLYSIANAKRVTVSMDGKNNKIIIGNFKHRTFIEFKNFLASS